MSDWLLGAWFFVAICLPWLLATAAWLYADRYHRKALEWKDRAEDAEAKAAYMTLKAQGFDSERLAVAMQEMDVSMEKAKEAFLKEFAADNAGDDSE